MTILLAAMVLLTTFQQIIRSGNAFVRPSVTQHARVADNCCWRPSNVPKRRSRSLSSSASAQEIESVSEEPGFVGNRPSFRIYYNDVYEVKLPKGHRFPMNKYRLVRETIQKKITSLPEVQRAKVDCGK